MTTVNLSTLNIRINKENAIYTNQTYINKHPDFQREYEAWDDKMKTRFIETMLLGRTMNPIWSILNPEENCEEILDGMHRVTTACDFLNNKFMLNNKYFTDCKFRKYNKKMFKDLSPDDQHNLRNYNFIFNNLDSSYRTDINKRKDMYEILNRSSKTLNDFEFNKVLYNSFYELISEYKDDFKKFLRKNDKRGEIEMEILNALCLSSDMPGSWTSITVLTDNYLKKNLGETEEEVNNFLEINTQEIKNKLEFIVKIINRLYDEKIFSKEKKIFNKLFLPYKFMIYRLAFKLKDIAHFNRHIKNIINEFRNQIINTDIQIKLECKSRNANFQKKLIKLIDLIIDTEYDPKDKSNDRLFPKEMIKEKLNEQNDICNICNCDLSNKKYHGDHIKKWSNGGKTEYSNLQVLCIPCHQNKE